MHVCTYMYIRTALLFKRTTVCMYVPKLTKSCSHFYRILANTAVKVMVQGLVAKVKDTVANGYFGMCIQCTYV